MLKRNRSLTTVAFLVLLLSPAAALADPPDTIVMRTAMLPANEVPPIVGLAATGTATITFFLNRDSTGLIASGTVDFDINYSGFPAGTTFTGLHIHNAPSAVNGSVVIGTNLGSGANSVFSQAGTGNIFRRVVVDGSNSTQLGFLRGVTAQPQLYYVNLHTTVNSGGAIRGQLAPVTLVFRALMSPDQENPPVTGFAASGVATTTIHVNQSADGSIVSGAVDFDVAYQFPAGVTLTGLHIHRGPAGTNGPVVISSGLGSGSNSIPVAAGAGNLYRRADIPSTDGTGLAALNGILADPTQFYVNLHTTVNPGGVIRGQLSPDTYTFRRPMLPLYEVPPISGTPAEGSGLITARVSRNASGNVASGSLEFNIDFSLGAAATITGLHIHNGAEGTNGSVVISSGLGAGDSVSSATGTGNITRTVSIASTDTAALEALKGLIEFPEKYYVNLHTTTNPGGLIRGQMENATLVYRVTMRPESEVPPVAGLNASAAATLVARLARNDQGNAIQGTFDFDVSHNLPSAVTFTGLHVHNSPAGVNGPVLIPSGIGGGASSVTSDSGAGVLFRRASIAPGSTDALGALDAMSKNPELFYVNLHSTIHPGGVVRAQLASNVYHFAQAGGGGGSSTSLSLTNPSATASASGFAYFFGADGKPLDTVVNNATVPFLIPPSGMVTLSTNSRSAVKSGYARVVSPDIVIPGFTFSVPGYAAASGEASTQDAFAFRAAVSRDGSGVNEAGVAVVNVSDQPVRVVLTLTSSGIARPAGRTTVILAPGQQISRFLGELFPGVGNFSGLLRIVGLTPFPSKTLVATVVQFTATQASVVPLTRVTKVEEVTEEN